MSLTHAVNMTNPKPPGQNSFTHGGDAGDVIYSLPTIKALGGGRLFLNLLPNVVREVMSKEKRDFLAPLLEAQSYISGVQMYSGQCICYNLNAWREYWRLHPEFGVSLAEWYCRTFETDPQIINQQWLHCDKLEIQPVVIHRSERYHLDDFKWGRVLEKYKGKIVFVGLKKEHEKFCADFSFLPFYPVKDALEMAAVIEGAKLFIGNQSLPAAIAEGLKKPKILEVFKVDPNSSFERADFQTVWTRTMYLPDL